MKKLVLALMLIGINSSVYAALTTHTIVKGDILWNLAGHYYADSTLWPAISDLNALPNPNSVAIGTVLIIPTKSEAQAIVNETDPTKKAQLIAQAKGESVPEETEDSNNDFNSDNNDGAARSTKKELSEDDTSINTVLNSSIDTKSLAEAADD